MFRFQFFQFGVQNFVRCYEWFPHRQTSPIHIGSVATDMHNTWKRKVIGVSYVRPGVSGPSCNVNLP
jgi:hypothetical protein